MCACSGKFTMDFNTVFTTIVVWNFFLATFCDAYIWNIAWGSIGTDEDLSNHPKNIYRDALERPQLDEPTYPFDPCTTDKSCGRHRFCDKFYGTCEPHRREGDACRRDGHCQKGFDCMFGKCQKSQKAGELGARCKHDRDCGSSMCCARQHGEKVCKAKLQLAENCYVPKGGLDYSLNELCPCDKGLICKDTGRKTPREEELTWQYWSSFEHMKCAHP
ncbi:dickkopf-related protein 3 [Lingula anatina]|uniref:Dickkopf-related protein 3 n=1 Tax=Lingula anatina TaxID=7574 RepID=A0A1S3JAW7_LINAN|nr:dickkopf-related protein 3 [Lingula anatina]|eukprot:XP_013407542.1 dickkopf-related protein 3 [Lingula anatina]